MIAHLNGILAEKSGEACVVEAGGVGYEVFLPAPVALALPALGETVRLYTHFHVREDAQVLYGFLRPQERQVFLLLMTVKGVGPKLALGILSNLGAESVVGALLRRDLVTLTKLPGVGKKLAERLGVELSDKAKELGVEAGSGQPMAFRRAPAAELALPGAWPQAAAALQSLGYSANQARQAVEEAYKILGQESLALEDMVKAALKTV
jgi:Holliday junction DNA helicase RuvA